MFACALACAHACAHACALEDGTVGGRLFVGGEACHCCGG